MNKMGVVCSIVVRANGTVLPYPAAQCEIYAKPTISTVWNEIFDKIKHWY